jgi:hypothetical protein
VGGAQEAAALAAGIEVSITKLPDIIITDITIRATKTRPFIFHTCRVFTFHLIYQVLEGRFNYGR